MKIPRLVIGGIRSGEGKTTIALGIMAALKSRGLSVQGFKVGPDYLDTGYQYLATERAGRNLDLWMMGADTVRQSFSRHAGETDISVIEGVMGLFDGHRDGVTPSSTADVAKTLKAPVVLVIDAAHLAASAGAIALGYRTFDPEVELAGVIFNRWNPARSKHTVEQAMARAGMRILGYIPPMEEIKLPSRHLGLVIADEMRDESTAVLLRLATLMIDYVEIDRLIDIAREAGDLPESSKSVYSDLVNQKVRIGVARDEAFAFYYPENIELLQQAGAEIVEFSPLADSKVPEVDGLYLGGGYPELYAWKLANNHLMRESIAEKIAGGLPTYAECGGFLYLCSTLTDLDGDCWPMAGVIPRQVKMHQRLQRMGYHEGIICRDSLLGPAGTCLRGHEFHYSSCEEEIEKAAYMIDGRSEGYSEGNLFASYLHIHFAAYSQLSTRWVDHCQRYKEKVSA